MRILYVCDTPTVSGAEKVLLGHLAAFVGPTYSTHVFCRRRNHRLIAALDQLGVAYTPSDSFSEIVIETTLAPRSLLHYGRSFSRVGAELVRTIRSQRIDLIHSIMYPAALYAAFAAKWTGRRQIWHEHGVKRVHAVNRHLYRFVGSSCAWVIGPSDAVTAPLAGAGVDPRKVRTVYNGIDLRRFSYARDRATALRRELGIPEGASAVGLFGQMLPHKGHRTLIQAAPAVLARHPNTRFFIVGALENPPYERELRQLASETAAPGSFHFTGWREDVEAVMGCMDVVVVPTLTPEPAALTLMEAMAMGRPLVATRTGGTPEIVLDGQTGLLFEPGDHTALAAKVCALLDDPGAAARLGAAGRLRVEERFSLARHLDEVRHLYESAVARRPS